MFWFYDKTYEICQKISLNDNRIKLFQNKDNQGLTKSLNILINKSKGKFIARHDADDISHLERFEKQIDYIDKFNLDACSSRALIIGSGKVIPNLSYYFPISLVLRYKNPVIHGSLMINKQVIQKLNLYNEEFKYSQDYELILKLYKNKYKFKIMKEPLYRLNMKNNISSKYKAEQKKYADMVRNQIRNKKWKI